MVIKKKAIVKKKGKMNIVIWSPDVNQDNKWYVKWWKPEGSISSKTFRTEASARKYCNELIITKRNLGYTTPKTIRVWK